MPKPRTCTQQIATIIRKFSLAEVRAAVEMAVELQKPAPAPASRKRTLKPKTMAAAVNLPERFDQS